MGYRSHRLIMDNVAGVRCFTEYLGRGQRIGLVPIGEKRALRLDHLQLAARIRLRRSISRNSSASSPTRAAAAPVRRAAAAREHHHHRDRGAVGWTTGSSTTKHRAPGRRGARHDAEHRAGRGHGDGGRRGARRGTGERRQNRGCSGQLRQAAQAARRDGDAHLARGRATTGSARAGSSCWLRNRRIERDGARRREAQAELERLLAFTG